MIKYLRPVILIGLALHFASCGSTKPYSGIAGTCSFTSGGILFCTDYSYSGQFKSDPSADVQSGTQSACASSAPSGSTPTFVSGATCNRTGATGICTITSSQTTSDQQTISITGVLVYPSSVNTATGQSSCASAHGTYRSL